GKFRCAGQTCVSMNRVYVHESIEEEFVKKMTEKTSSLKLGDGLDPQTSVGPLVNEKGVQKVEKQVKDAVSKGANIAVGGKRPAKEALKNGSFFEHTIMTNVNEEMYISYYVTFGSYMSYYSFVKDNCILE